MKATIVGFGKTDFNGRDGNKVKQTKFHLLLEDSPDVEQGNAVDYLTWDEVKNGPPPEIKLNSIYEVQYGKNGKLSFINKKTA